MMPELYRDAPDNAAQPFDNAVRDDDPLALAISETLTPDRGRGRGRVGGYVAPLPERGAHGTTGRPQPDACCKLTERVSTLGLEGFGSAELTVRQTGHAPVETELSMRMGAIGVTGAVLDGSGPNIVGLTLKSDAMWVRTESERGEGLMSARGDAPRAHWESARGAPGICARSSSTAGRVLGGRRCCGPRSARRRTRAQAIPPQPRIVRLRRVDAVQRDPRAANAVTQSAADGRNPDGPAVRPAVARSGLRNGEESARKTTWTDLKTAEPTCFVAQSR